MWLAAAAGSLIYLGGMAFNDWFDRHDDALGLFLREGWCGDGHDNERNGDGNAEAAEAPRCNVPTSDAIAHALRITDSMFPKDTFLYADPMLRAVLPVRPGRADGGQNATTTAQTTRTPTAKTTKHEKK